MASEKHYQGSELMNPDQTEQAKAVLNEIAYKPYADPEEFIVEWTDRIWVERGVGLIRENYAPDSIVHGAYGTGIGVEPVVRSTLTKISGFPDRVGQAEDVVWEARGDDAFLSSHRIFSSGTDTSLSTYGPPSGRRYSAKTIANCLYRRGVMEEEWVVRDEFAVISDLGLDPAAVARDLAFSEFTGSATLSGSVDVLTGGDSGPRPDLFRGECDFVLEMIEEVWNQRNFDRIGQYVPRDVLCHTTRNRTLSRQANFQSSIIDMLAPFPDARIHVRDIAANYSEHHGGLRVAVVWWLTGTYTGVPAYGRPTGSPVQVLGSSQFLFRDGKITTEWRIYDELSTLTQIVHARGDEPVVISGRA
ncbi:ester cyclase [Rhodococcus sp. NPDC057135]|uniref:nuclear transport factor 2 family protein n=1 Tax=Rhodococcus sp. NPDC057135 TaxID=3346028 RepID=UPI003640D382